MRLGDENVSIMMEFSRWILAVNQQEGLKVPLWLMMNRFLSEKAAMIYRAVKSK